MSHEFLPQFSKQIQAIEDLSDSIWLNLNNQQDRQDGLSIPISEVEEIQPMVNYMQELAEGQMQLYKAILPTDNKPLYYPGIHFADSKIFTQLGGDDLLVTTSFELGGVIINLHRLRNSGVNEEKQAELLEFLSQEIPKLYFHHLWQVNRVYRFLTPYDLSIGSNKITYKEPHPYYSLPESPLDFFYSTDSVPLSYLLDNSNNTLSLKSRNKIIKEKDRRTDSSLDFGIGWLQLIHDANNLQFRNIMLKKFKPPAGTPIDALYAYKMYHPIITASEEFKTNILVSRKRELLIPITQQPLPPNQQQNLDILVYNVYTILAVLDPEFEHAVRSALVSEQSIESFLVAYGSTYTQIWEEAQTLIAGRQFEDFKQLHDTLLQYLHSAKKNVD